MKTILKFFITLLTIFYLLTSCEKEEFDITQEKNNITINEVEFNKIKQDEPFNKILTNQFAKNINNRSDFENLNKFSISNQKVKVIENDSVKSYTFNIIRDSINYPNEFENLIIQINKNKKTISGCTLSYITNSINQTGHNSFNFKGIIKKNNLKSLKHTTNSNKYNSTESDCFATVTMCNELGVGYPSLHVATSDCNNKNYLYTFRYKVLCPASEGGGGVTNNNIFNPTDGGFGNPYDGIGGSSTLTNEDANDVDFVTSPVLNNLLGSNGQPIKKTPCDELNKLTSDTIQKAALSGLKSETGLSFEKGFAISKDNATNDYKLPTPIQANTNTPNEVPMMEYVGGSNIGCFHTHPTDEEGWIPMFSDGDINYLYYVAIKHDNGNTPRDYAEYIITLTVPEGTFALKIKDWAKFAIARNNTDNWELNKLQKLRDKYNNHYATDDIIEMKKDLLTIF